MPLPNNFTDDNTITPARSDADTAYAAAILIDQNHPNSEGGNLPPPQRGENKVPTPGGFQVLGIPTYSALGFVYTLSWQDIPDGASTHVRAYRVYAQGSFDSNPNPSLVGTSANSPCTVRVVATKAGVITFWLQPVLGNGMFLPLSACPTCTSMTPDPYFQFIVTDPGTGDMIEMNINSGLPAGLGSVATGMDVQDLTTLEAATMTAKFIVLLSATAKPLISMAHNGAGGILRVFDGSGSGGYGSGQTILVDGLNGVVQARAQVNIGLPGDPDQTQLLHGLDSTGGRTATGNYWPIVINGTTYYVPLYT